MFITFSGAQPLFVNVILLLIFDKSADWDANFSATPKQKTFIQLSNHLFIWTYTIHVAAKSRVKSISVLLYRVLCGCMSMFA